ncbi:MAG: hypothetical protein JMN24_07375 [gamma proteobacterium endosymbiont of Lamellibrachia anaximandri]|nr:hypothetical protein [gamma proteobacterium endosymbiont of Lamellibrachia anaximandri]MBL3616424.1 hypothetical protein [gamma proteobacterium endosymbiont of Lamellibrachia anaximandri]
MFRKTLITVAIATLLPISATVFADATVAPDAAADATAIEQELVTEPTIAAEAVSAEAAPVVAAEPVLEESAAAPAEAPVPVAAAPSDSRMMEHHRSMQSMEERMKAREKRYEALQKRALESGVLLPDHPSWMGKPEVADLRPSMEERMERMKALRNMDPEERDAYRLERYQDMRERAAEVGLDLPVKPPWKDRPARPELNQDDEWARQQAVIDGMTPEERAACHAMHRRHMRQMGPGRGMMQPPQMPAMPGRGFGPGRMMGPGAGYGPQGNFWDPSR